MKPDIHPFTLRQLQYVVAVADLKSFRRAAERCHVSQPSLSAQVAQCEELIGVRLFERDRRSVGLTGAGVELVERMRALLVAADDLVEVARGLGDPLSGVVRLGVIPTVSPYLLPEVAPTLRSALPRLELRWLEDKTPRLVSALARGELDAAIVALEAELGDVRHLVLGRDPFVFAAAPDHPLVTTRRKFKLEDLDGERLLLLDDGHCFRDQALAACSRVGALEADFRATSLQTLVQMAATGQAATLLPMMAVGIENRRGDLRVRRFAGKAPQRTIALAWRRLAARTQTFEAIGRVLADAFPRAIELAGEALAER